VGIVIAFKYWLITLSAGRNKKSPKCLCGHNRDHIERPSDTKRQLSVLENYIGVGGVYNKNMYAGLIKSDLWPLFHLVLVS
jgi:hypothetical protein